RIKDGILQMAAGDLKTSLPQYNKDEIGILAEELDKLRITLDDTLQQEQESRQANQDLITAMSHDLRTPLTILNGYLEVLRLNKSPDMKEEYLNRCLQKTKDIKDMTDRMFEYALIFEENETPDLEPLAYSFFHECLMENIDFIHLAGFKYDLESVPADVENEPCFIGDSSMIKRIFNNLFSNILKYGDKSVPVRITFSFDSHELKILVKNSIKEEHADIESNHIGLRSVEKMMSLLNGRILYSEKNNEFAVQLTFGEYC
ncbi:MAG: histidine kinase dimerization/phospho-acceptor domain-containing protein, partial [Agathobacter sp.]|nr:histidine kinase dimerization/phospho-acceptor domain-containing protein [Agathobacter sp.]